MPGTIAERMKFNNTRAEADKVVPEASAPALTTAWDNYQKALNDYQEKIEEAKVTGSDLPATASSAAARGLRKLASGTGRYTLMGLLNVLAPSRLWKKTGDNPDAPSVGREHADKALDPRNKNIRNLAETQAENIKLFAEAKKDLEKARKNLVSEYKNAGKSEEMQIQLKELEDHEQQAHAAISAELYDIASYKAAADQFNKATGKESLKIDLKDVNPAELSPAEKFSVKGVDIKATYDANGQLVSASITHRWGLLDMITGRSAREEQAIDQIINGYRAAEIAKMDREGPNYKPSVITLKGPRSLQLYALRKLASGYPPMKAESLDNKLSKKDYDRAEELTARQQEQLKKSLVDTKGLTPDEADRAVRESNPLTRNAMIGETAATKLTDLNQTISSATTMATIERLSGDIDKAGSAAAVIKAKVEEIVKHPTQLDSFQEAYNTAIADRASPASIQALEKITSTEVNAIKEGKEGSAEAEKGLREKLKRNANYLLKAQQIMLNDNLLGKITNDTSEQLMARLNNLAAPMNAVLAGSPGISNADTDAGKAERKNFLKVFKGTLENQQDPALAALYRHAASKIDSANFESFDKMSKHLQDAIKSVPEIDNVAKDTLKKFSDALKTPLDTADNPKKLNDFHAAVGAKVDWIVDPLPDSKSTRDVIKATLHQSYPGMGFSKLDTTTVNEFKIGITAAFKMAAEEKQAQKIMDDLNLTVLTPINTAGKNKDDNALNRFKDPDLSPFADMIDSPHTRESLVKLLKDFAKNKNDVKFNFDKLDPDNLLNTFKEAITSSIEKHLKPRDLPLGDIPMRGFNM